MSVALGAHDAGGATVDTTAPPVEQSDQPDQTDAVAVRHAPLTAAQVRRYGPWAMVVLLMIVQAVMLRGATWKADPARSNDMVVHTAMVRWAEQQIDEGHLPLDGWFPDASLGAPQFHQYQSFPHVVTAYVGDAIGADAESMTRWVTYLLLVAWPLVMFAAMRMLFGDDLIAIAAAVLAPLASSVPGFGYELSSYLWIGLGLWTQLIGMTVAPFAIALTWRALDRGKGYALAALMVALTIICHFMTGYMVFIWLAVVAFAGPKDLLTRVRRAALVGIGALAAAAFQLVPLLSDNRWIGETQSAPGHLRDSYGAEKVLRWLFTGNIFDARRAIPVVSLLVAVGVIRCIAKFRRDALLRCILCFWVVNLLLYFGRRTFGSALDLLPFGGGPLGHRYVVAVQFGGVILAAIGAATLVRGAWTAHRKNKIPLRPSVFVALVAVAALVVVWPAFSERDEYAAGDRILVKEQQAAFADEGAQLTALIDRANRLGGGRIYAGTPSGVGLVFLVGYSTVYEEIFNHDAPALGFTGRIASLSTDTEHRFDPTNPADWDLFGAKYYILPGPVDPEIPATRIKHNGRFVLWEVGDGGYLGVYDTVGPAIQATRANLGAKTKSFLESSLPAEHTLRPIAFDGDKAAAPTAKQGTVPADPPGAVSNERDKPDDGVFAGDVTATRRSVVVLKNSYHRRWEVTVDGKSRPTQMVAPSFVGVTVGPGTHRVEFRYVPYPTRNYVLLVVLGIVLLLALALVPRRMARHKN